MYVLDTDTLSNLTRRAPSGALIAKLANAPADQLFTSSITLGELVHGASRLRDRAAALLERIERLALPNLEILPFDEQAARRYGELRARLERQGTPIGEGDTRIASIALSHGFIVVTANLRYYQRVPDLRVENWLA